MNVVIPLIPSMNNDLELMYCLRSIEKHLKGYQSIVIVGHLPNFINPETVVHIPFKDGSEKQLNIRNKIIAAFNHTDSEYLFFTNDDVFLLQDFDVDKFPYYYSGDLKDASEKACKYAHQELLEANLGTLWFDSHFSIIYKRSLFLEAMRHYSDKTAIKSTYCNHWGIKGEYCKDLKIGTHVRHFTIRNELKGRPCFSIGDRGLTYDMKIILNELYPNQSKYELSNQQIKAA
jgi:hypothetical protein